MSNEAQQKTASTIVHEDYLADRRLGEMGLSATELRDVIEQGEFMRAQATEHDPLAAGPSDAYRYRVRSFRDVYCPRGWTIDREANLERTCSPCGRRAIITRGGDRGVGIKKAHPQPSRPVGEVTAREATKNASLALNPDWFNMPVSTSPAAGDRDRETWMLLVYRERDVVRSELSRPAGVTGEGRVLTWVERILLPEIDLSIDPSKMQPATTEPEAIDVPVTRKR